MAMAPARTSRPPSNRQLSLVNLPPPAHTMTSLPGSSEPYAVPGWAAKLPHAPAKKLHLAHLPTPIFPFAPPGVPEGVKMYIKRDDYTGLELSGNKIRKLEFLLQEALDQGADCVVTCGGVQSNHCRATAVAARTLGLEAHLLLFAEKPDEDPGLVGNLMMERLVGAKISTVAFEDFLTHGMDTVLEKFCERLRNQNRRPYAIPAGGSNALGTWGYLQAVDEMQTQLKSSGVEISDIAFASGSGGTATGLGLGSYLYSQHNAHDGLNFSQAQRPVHAYLVGGSEDQFMDIIDKKILPAMGVSQSLVARQFLQLTDAQGTGYASSTKEELDFVASVAQKTGVIVDPVYSGKALFHLIRELNEAPEKFVGKSILYVHTGGQFGIYSKADRLQFLSDGNPAEHFNLAE